MVSKIMISFGELFTKGKNRKDFIRILAQNIKHAIRGYHVTIETKHDHIYVSNFQIEQKETIIQLLQNISGISVISEVEVFPRDLDVLKEYALKTLNESRATTFKIVAKRKDKTFPLRSDLVNRTIATYLLQNSTARVDVHYPEFTFTLEIDFDFALVIAKRYSGSGGFPLGSAGKGMVLISGGIDSPVATYLTLRRGIKIEAIHFAAPPYTSEEVISKIKRLLGKLNIYQAEIKLHIVPFTALQVAIYEHVPVSYAITIMRRMMLRIATVVAKRSNNKILITGESLGQVASQTLESLVVINEVTNMPIIRPLATVDKKEIIEISKQIGTYDISIEPYEDCCTIFPVKNPVTSPRLDEALKFEQSFNFEELIKEAIYHTKRVTITASSDDSYF